MRYADSFRCRKCRYKVFDGTEISIWYEYGPGESGMCKEPVDIDQLLK